MPGKHWYTCLLVGTCLFFFLGYYIWTIISGETREHLHDHFDDEFDKWMVGLKNGIVHVPLDCLGPWHQLHWGWSWEGCVQALDIGGVSLPIYAGKDQFSTFVPIMWVLPNVCLGDTIGHLFLDMVEEYGCKFLMCIVFFEVTEIIWQAFCFNAHNQQRLWDLGDGLHYI